jgi:NDP-sugar pyrophosphorylase family protein
MRAVILAGGKGIRLRPYTTCLPKPLVPIGGECAILELLLRQLRLQGFGHVTLAIGHLGDLIRSYVGDGSQWGLTVDYWHEQEPLGTVGPLIAHRDEIVDDVVVLNADLLCDVDFADLLAHHRRTGAELTIASYPRVVGIDFGVLDVSDGRLRGFEEKPTVEYLVNMGIYALSPSVLAGFDRGSPLGFDQLVAVLLGDGRSPHVYRFDGYWLDIGRPEDYDRANLEFETIERLLLGRRARSDVHDLTHVEGERLRDSEKAEALR